MADVRWIKITTDMFDNRKIRHLRRLPDGNNIVLIWVMLLTMAGRCNASGMIFLTENIPYSPKMLADELDFEENTVILALKALEQLNMIVTNGSFFSIAGWEEYQNIEGMEKIREQNRLRKAKYDARQKALSASNVTGNVTVTQSNATDIDKEIDIEIEKDIDIEEDTEDKRPPVPYETIKNIYNEICVSFPKCNTLSSNRKKSIKARFTSGYTVEDFKTLFTKAEASNFLKGKNNRNWSATFDWLIKDTNMAKVLDGNYDEEKKGRKEMIPAFMQGRPGDDVERMKKMIAQMDDIELQERAEKLKQRLAE